MITRIEASKQTRCRAIVRSACSKEYIELLEANHIQISMTEKGDPLENAIAERVNGILKNEYLTHQPLFQASPIGIGTIGLSLQLQTTSLEW